MMGVNADLSPEEAQLVAKRALLLERQRELEDLRVKFKQMQQEKKNSSLKISSAESPSQATEIAKKLAASGQLKTTKNSGSRTTGFKRSRVATSVTTAGDVDLSDLEGDKIQAEENEVPVDSILADSNDESSTTTVNLKTESGLEQIKFKKPKIQFVKSSTPAFDSPESSKLPQEKPLYVNKGNKQQFRKEGKEFVPHKGNTIFIRNTGISESVVRSLTQPFGEVHNVTCDKGGHYFVTFTTMQAAESAIEGLHGKELVEDDFGSDIISMANMKELTLHVTYAKSQRHVHIAQDLKHDWSRVSAGVKNPAPSSTPKRDRKVKTYDDDPF